MQKNFIDLHTHSTVSDGTDSPVELMRNAAACGLSAVALTDHDTLDGLNEAAAEAAGLGIRFVRGIEIAVRYEYGELHLLGLWMPAPSARMREALEGFRRGRQVRNLKILASLGKMGLPVDLDEVLAISGGGTVGRPHIALAMKRRGYVQDWRDAFTLYIGQNGRAFVPRVLLSPEEGIGLLRGEGATVVLAHPCLFHNMGRQMLDSMLGQLKELGLHAVEAYYSVHSSEQVRLCVDLAAKHGLLLSGGSELGKNL